MNNNAITREHARSLDTVKSGLLNRVEKNAMYDHDQWSENKQSQREFVLGHALTLEGRIRSLTLPGMYWTFEELLFSHRRDLFCAGCEKDAYTFDVSRKYLLKETSAERTKHCSWRFPWGHSPAATTGRSGLINIDIESVFLGNARFVSWKSQKTARKYTKSFNLIFIDSNSPLGCEFMTKVLCNAHSLFAGSRTIICLSFLVGRDSPGFGTLIQACPGKTALRRRCNYAAFRIQQSTQRAVTLLGSHSYRSASGNTARIGTVALEIAGPSKLDLSSL